MSFRNPSTVKADKTIASPLPPAPVPRSEPASKPGFGTIPHQMLVSSGKTVIVLGVYIFLIYSRVPEVIGALLGPFRIALVLMAILTVLTILRSRASMLTSGPVFAIILFTLWMIACVPASVWPGGSIRLIVFTWPVALMSFWFASSIISTLKDCEIIVRSFALGVMGILIIYFLFGVSVGNRTGMTIAGTLGNANILAFQILVGLPLCLYFLMRNGGSFLSKAFYLAITLLGLYVVGVAGSRSGLIALIAATVLLMIRSSALARLRLIAMFLTMVAVAVVVLPREVLSRYITLFSDDPNLTSMSDEVLSARDSTAARRYHLQQGIDLTLSHPIFGIGPGQFPVASADLSREKNERAQWLETHNSYVQISSETGVIGLLLYLWMLLGSVSQLYSVYRDSRKRREWSIIADMTFCLLLCFVTTMINCFFGSMAYMIYMPVLSGFAVGLCRVARAAMSATLTQPATPAPPLFPAFKLNTQGFKNHPAMRIP